MKNLSEAFKKSMINKLEQHSLNDMYYIVIPWTENLRKCITNSDALFINNKIYDSGYSSFFIATKEQAKELKNITGENCDLIFAICAKKQYSTIDEIIKDYFGNYLEVSSKKPT